MDYNNNLLDQLVDLKPHDLVYKIRQKRPLTIQANQRFFELILSCDIQSLSQNERIYTAFYTSLLTKQPILQDYFTHQSPSLSTAILKLIALNRISDISDPKLKAILQFTQRVTLNPDSSTPQHLLELQNHGLTTQAIVVLAQLIGFIAYQARLIAGLTAINDYVKAENIHE